MKLERDHGDNFYLPPDDFAPYDETQVRKKDTEYVQVRRGVIDYPVNADEYYSRQSYDYLDEQRGTLPNTGVNTVIDFGRIVKSIWVFCPSGSASSVFVNFNGGPAANANGSIQVLAGEGRQFFIPVERINISSDGANQATYRVTWGY